jgi:hypothetical protein
MKNHRTKDKLFSRTFTKLKIVPTFFPDKIKVLIGFFLVLVIVSQLQDLKILNLSFKNKPTPTPETSLFFSLTPVPTLTDKEEASRLINFNILKCPNGSDVINWLVSTINKNSISSKEESGKAKENNKEFWACYILNEESYTNPSPTIDLDPIEPCTSKNSGDSIKVKRSECQNNYVDCQINSTYKVLKREDCTNAQKAEADQKYQQWKANNPIYTIAPWPTIPTYPPCVVYYPALGYSQTYLYTSPDQCQQWQNQEKSVSTVTQITPANSTQSQKLSQEQINDCKSRAHQEIQSLIKGCYIQFGDSSASAACAGAYQKQGQKQQYDCETYGKYTQIDGNIYIPKEPTPIVPVGYGEF